MRRFWSPRVFSAIALLSVVSALSACGGGNVQPASQADIAALKASPPRRAPPAGRELHVWSMTSRR